MSRELLDLVIQHKGGVVERLRVHADPDNGQELRELLLAAMARRGHDAAHAPDYLMDVEPVDAYRGPGFTFAMTESEE
jgi:hypothetical protein